MRRVAGNPKVVRSSPVLDISARGSATYFSSREGGYSNHFQEGKGTKRSTAPEGGKASRLIQKSRKAQEPERIPKRGGTAAGGGGWW